MTLMVNRGLDSALNGKMGPGVTDQEIGFTALVIWATHPLTWLIAYAGVEGTVRLGGAAFTDTSLGILPLFVLDKIIGKFSGCSEQSPVKAAGYSEANFSSYVGAIREKVMVKGLAQVPDELCFTGSATDGILNTHTDSINADCDPRRNLRYQRISYILYI